MKQILTDGFSGIVVAGQVEDQKMMKGKLTDGKKIVNRFRGKLVKMIKDAGVKFDNYSISPKSRQYLLHWVMNQLKKIFLLTQFQTINYINGEFNKKLQTSKHFIGSILDDNLHNQDNNLNNQ